MAEQSIIVSRTRFVPAPPAVESTEIGGASPSGESAAVPFDMEHHEQTQWCWAAVAVSVSAYYDKATTWRQCTLVDAELGLQTCCDSGADPACNRPWYLDRALHRVDHLDRAGEGPTTWQTVASDLAGGRPVAVRIEWPAGDGHLVVLVAVRHSAHGMLVEVHNPAYPSRVLPWDLLLNGYLSTGRWTHTYWTRP